MSVKSPVKKPYSKCRILESSNLSSMSEHLTDSNILCSRKTYGKNKDYRNLSISEENGVSLPTFISEHLKNNGTSLLSNYSEELYPEKNFESLATVASNFGENSNVQKDNVVNSEICLFNDEDTDYYFSVSTESSRDHNSFPSTPEALNTSSNYQRTRKNLKNRLSNQYYNSEETSGSASHKENFTSSCDSESSNTFLNLTQASSTKQNFLASITSVDNQVVHTQNKIKTSDVCVNKLPGNSIVFPTTNQAGKTFGTGTMLQNSSNAFSILDLVSRFTVSGNKAAKKTNPCNKRKKNQKECEPVPVKKISVVKDSVPTIVNSVEKKIPNSFISIGNHSKSDLILPPKASKHHLRPKKGNNEFVDNMKESVGVIKSANNISLPKKGNVKTPSKAVQKGKNTSIDSSEKIQKVVPKDKITKNVITAKVKFTSSSLATSVVRNESAEKILLDNLDKQIEKPRLVQSEECTIQNQALYNFSQKSIASNSGTLMPTTSAPVSSNFKKDGLITLPLMVTPSDGKNVILSDYCAVSNENFRDSSIPGPSTLNTNDLHMKTINYNRDVCAKGSLLPAANSTTVRNPTHDNYRPRIFVSPGIEFHRFIMDKLRKITKDSLSKRKENARKFKSEKALALTIKVREFLELTDIKNALNDFANNELFLKDLPPNPNKGYDFSENFEDEDLMRVVKDYVHTALSYIIPLKVRRPSHVPYLQIIQAANKYMSKREKVVIMRVFQNTDISFKISDVVSRLSFVALFLIFDEYEKKKLRIGKMNIKRNREGE